MPLLAPLVDVMMHKGITDPDAFLAPSVWRDLPSPFAIKGMEEGVTRILAAVRAGERILIFGDYDCDGVLSTAILDATLRKLGARPEICLPHRDDGYGLTHEAVHRFSLAGTDLVIAIDNGINAAEAVRLAARLAIAVVVVDHHQIETPVETTCVWSDEFCAAGLGLMLCLALFDRARVPTDDVGEFRRSLSRLAAIASIADCVPLTGATRIITRIGLRELANTRHAGLRRLLTLAGVRGGMIPTSEEIAFRVAPRINAAGRVAHPEEALLMLRATTANEQIALAVNLDRLNKERRRLERAAMEELVLSVGGGTPRGLVIYGPRWKKGIAGILASRAVERYGVPAFVLVLDKRTGMAVGSGRSIDGVSLIDALRTAKTLLHRFGGHKQAAGVTLRVENIPQFREAFEEFLLHCKHGPAIQPDPDADLDLTSVTRLFNEQLRSFGPFGIGNLVPVFRVQDASIRRSNPGFTFVKQKGREIKARGEYPGERNGTALLALNGTSASLAGFAPCPD